MNVLVTGGAGYIGGCVATILREQGHEVFILDNLCHARESDVPAGCRFTHGDVSDRSVVLPLLKEIRPDGVLHFAALIEAGESMKLPALYFQNNTAATLTFLECLVEAGVEKIVFSSTAAVYGEPEHVPITEDAPLRPTNPYGESKLMVERMLRWFHQVHGLRYASLRYFNVAGALAHRGEAHEPESHLIPLILDVALGRREAISVYGTDYATTDGTCIRDYIHIRDLATAHLIALQALSSNDRLIYNLGNGNGFSVRQVIDAARSVTGQPIRVQEQARRAGDPAILVASSERIARELGWSPAVTSIEAVIESAWRWHRQRYR